MTLAPPLALPGLIRLGPTTTSGNVIEGPVGLGFDYLGTVRDFQGQVTYEEHVLDSPSGAFGAMPLWARYVLVLAIAEYLATHTDQGWETIRADLVRSDPPPVGPMLARTGDTTPPEAFAFLFQNGGGDTGKQPWPPQPPTVVVPPPFQPSNYVFSLDSMTITNTRSRHGDSDKASLSLAVGSAPAQTVTRDLGDLNNGTFALTLQLPVRIEDPNIGVATNYLVVNSGHQDWSTVNVVLTQAGSALASAGAKAATAAVGGAIGATIGSSVVPVIGTALGAIAGWLIGEITGLLTANGDGPVAAEQPAFKGVDLWNRTGYVGGSFQHTTYHPGIDSPSGCGSNSQYFVTWSVTRFA